jgi:hypothetical protein
MALIDNILAYWNFNDNGSGEANLTDLTGNGNNLVVYNGSNSLVNGIIGGGSLLSGNVLAPASGEGSILAFGYSDFSVSLWFYPTGAPDNNQVILANVVWPQPTGFVIGYDDDTQVSCFLGNFVERIAYPSFAYNQWHHLVVTRESGTAKFYVDSVLAGSATWLAPMNDGLWYIGRAQDVDNFYGTGTIDEFGAWTRALSGAEVTELYNNGNALAYPFIEGGGGVALDIFRLINLPWFITFGGGVSSKANIARLLNLPWFIKI